MKVISHVPTINQTNVFRNETIQVYFDNPIIASSITWETISLNNTNTFTSVPCDIGPIWISGINLSGITSGVYLRPQLNLNSNTQYSVYIYGNPNSILATNGDYLDNTYSFNFITGTGYYTTTGDIGTPSGTITDTTNDYLYGLGSGLFVRYTNPQNQEPNININSGQIDIFFNIPIMTSISDLSGLIVITSGTVL